MDIFGDRGKDGPNGFEYLALLDRNGDGVIDSQDPAFPYLRLWSDRNRDAKLQPGEDQTLASAGITALYLDYNATGREDREGNEFRYKAHLVRNGHIESYYDVYFGTH